MELSEDGQGKVLDGTAQREEGIPESALERINSVRRQAALIEQHIAPDLGSSSPRNLAAMR